MKKILLSMALAGATVMGVNAQELVFLYEGKPMENGATIDFKEIEVTEVTDAQGNPMPGFLKYKVDPHINILSDENAEVTVTTVSNVAVNLCAGGDCINGTNNVKNNVNLTEDVPLDIQMDWDMSVYDGSQIDVPAITVEISAYYNYAPENVITLTVNMGGFNSGVESLAVNAGKVNVTGRTLNYDINGAGTICVYSLSGKTVVNREVAGNGHISLASLPAGVYIYKMTGKNAKTGKFIIK